MLWTNGTTLEASGGTITVHDTRYTTMVFSSGLCHLPTAVTCFRAFLLCLPHTTLVDASKPFGVIACLHVWAIVSGQGARSGVATTHQAKSPSPSPNDTASAAWSPDWRYC